MSNCTLLISFFFPYRFAFIHLPGCPLVSLIIHGFISYDKQCKLPVLLCPQNLMMAWLCVTFFERCCLNEYLALESEHIHVFYARNKENVSLCYTGRNARRARIARSIIAGIFAAGRFPLHSVEVRVTVALDKVYHSHYNAIREYSPAVRAQGWRTARRYVLF